MFAFALLLKHLGHNIILCRVFCLSYSRLNNFIKLHIGKNLIGFCQEGINFAAFESCPEFERCGTLKQLAHTLRLLHAGEFHKDASCVADFLNRRLGYAETVDTVAQYIERVGNRAFGFGSDNRNHLFIGAFRLDTFSHFVGSENTGKPFAAGNLFPCFCKQGYEVALRIHAAHFGKFNGFVEFGTRIVARKRPYKVLQLHLQHYVHTALEVQTEVEFLAADILIGITEIYFLSHQRVDVILFCLFFNRIEIISPVNFGHLGESGALLGESHFPIGSFFRLVSMNYRNQSERQLPEAG